MTVLTYTLLAIIIMGNIVVCMYRMINKSLDQGCRGINRLSMKLFISIIFDISLTTFKLAGYNSKCFKENIKCLLLNHTTVMEIVVKMVIGFIRLIFFLMSSVRD
jgi:hypothetical protein